MNFLKKLVKLVSKLGKNQLTKSHYKKINFQINIEKDNKFRLEGCNIYTSLNLTPWEAALGERIAIEGIDSTETVYIQKGIQSGDKIKIQGKGYKDGKGGRGDLVAEVKIMVPKNLTEEETRIYQKLKEVSTFNPR